MCNVHKPKYINLNNALQMSLFKAKSAFFLALLMVADPHWQQVAVFVRRRIGKDWVEAST